MMTSMDLLELRASFTVYRDSWLEWCVRDTLEALLRDGLADPVTPAEWREHVAFYHPEDCS